MAENREWVADFGLSLQFYHAALDGKGKVMNGSQRDRIKVTTALSNISKFIQLEWLCETFDWDRFDLSFIILNAGDSEIETWLRERDISVE